MINVTVIGRLTTDPELKIINGEKTVVKFGLAVNRKQGGKDNVQFLNVAAFGKSGEVIAEHVKKGEQICVTGKLFITKSEKGDKTFVDVILDSFKLLGGKKAE